MDAKKFLFVAALLAFLMAAAQGFLFPSAQREVPFRQNRGAEESKATHIVALTGDEDYIDDQSAWDKTYSRNEYVFGKEPSQLLVQFLDDLPKGRSLDIAMGEGRNTVYLARRGFLSEGVDISAVGIKKAQKLANENKVKIYAINADLQKYKIRPNHYEVIINFYYLQRNLIPQIKAGLKKGGVVVFETNTMDQLKLPGGSGWQKEYLLHAGELKSAFSDFEILHYTETNNGQEALASLVARKR